MTYDEAKFAALIVCKQLRSVALFWYYEDKITLNHKKAWLLFFDEVEKEIIKL